MMYEQDITPSFEDSIGADGATKQEFTQALKIAQNAVAKLQARRKDGSWPVLTVAEREDDFIAIEEAARGIAEDFDTLVVLGMGASSRGGETLVALARNPFTGLAGGKRIHFIDNIDPFTFDQLLESVPIKTTLFLVISKSGGTAESMAQLLVLLHEVERRLDARAIGKHFLFITEPGRNPLRAIGEERGIAMLEHDPDIGGRFAGLTAVGLLPAKVAGLDIKAIRQGAAEVVEHTFQSASPAPALGAALNDTLLRKGRSVTVMMPYCDRLEEFSAWHQQLWEESLGKKGHGTTALRALGAVDQHSQLQLYLDGPRDKFLTMLLLEQEGKGMAIPPSQDASLAYLKNHTIGDLMAAEQMATVKTLTRNRHPLRVFSLKALNEATLGALMMHFMLETMIIAQLWQIDPFGQPAVEESKELARRYLAGNA